MWATRLREILGDDKHAELHGWNDDRVGVSSRGHEFAELLTLPKLHARVVGVNVVSNCRLSRPGEATEVRTPDTQLEFCVCEARFLQGA